MNGAGEERSGTRGEPHPEDGTAPAHAADAARRALRAARERESADGDVRTEESSTADSEVAVPGTGVQQEVRPGDAARAALRRANAERRGGGRAEEGTAAAQDTAREHLGVVRQTSKAPDAARETAPAARPGDDFRVRSIRFGTRDGYAHARL